jgi:transketolase
MNMRQQLVQTVETIMSTDSRIMLLLGDIGVFGFRNAFKNFPERVYNIGILEQATVSLAAGLAMVDYIPVIHTIAPFLIERSLEQLKIDFCYQKLCGNFISVGASYDYAALGCTHHCPGDVGILKNLPGMEIVLPGTSLEFDTLFHQGYANGHPTYYRLSERSNSLEHNVTFGKAEVLRKGSQLVIVAIGPALEQVLDAAKDFDVTILYYTTVMPFDAVTLRNNTNSSKILLCEPYYTGILSSEIITALYPKPITIDHIGIPLNFLTNYGQVEEHDEQIGLTSKQIKKRIAQLIG